MDNEKIVGVDLSEKEDVVVIDGHPVKVVEYSDGVDDTSDYCAECMIKFPDDE